jgi:type IV pilus assembly protein PilQ
MWMLLTFALAIAPAQAQAQVPSESEETRISMDIRDAPINDIVLLLSEVGGFQVVLDPGIACKLTLKLREVRWQSALDVALRSCGLEREEEGGIMRVAPAGKLTAENEARRKLKEAAELARPRSLTTFRLSYARAAELAPLIKKMLSPAGEVVVDARTNTLIVID